MTCYHRLYFQVGSAGSGKTSAVRLLSQLLGQELRVLSINCAVDTSEILGGFEQVGCTTSSFLYLKMLYVYSSRIISTRYVV